MRSNSRENVTVVTTISTDGTTWKPTIIFKGQRVQADWMSEENGPPDARYTATDSSFMQGTVFLNYLKAFHKQLGERDLLGRKPHVLLLNGHASHACYGVIRLAIELDIVLFQLPSHTSHITQPLDIAAFGSFKKEVTKVLTTYPFKHGGTLPLKRDMVGVIGGGRGARALRRIRTKHHLPGRVYGRWTWTGRWVGSRARGRGSRGQPIAHP
jgi:4-hydroxybenzoate polyprenyltransferase